MLLEIENTPFDGAVPVVVIRVAHVDSSGENGYYEACELKDHLAAESSCGCRRLLLLA
jgi:hypothetical protein